MLSKNRAITFFLFLWAFNLVAQEYTLLENVSYYGENLSDSYQSERCKLDLYYPKGIKNFPTVVWFHGGGLKAGNKSVPEQLKEKGIAVVAVNYRLHPKVKAPVYIEDAAAALAWTFRNIAKHGGDPDKIIVSGSPAGGYLTLMVGLEKVIFRPITLRPMISLPYCRLPAIPSLILRLEPKITSPKPNPLSTVLHLFTTSGPMLPQLYCIPEILNWKCWDAQKKMLI